MVEIRILVHLSSQVISGKSLCDPTQLKCCFSIKIFAFSYDARLGGLDDGKRWSDADRGFGHRAVFHVDQSKLKSSGANNKVMSYLNVNDIKSEEAGVYKCRVDFKSAPTRNYNVNVTVIGESFHLYKIYAVDNLLFLKT